MLLDGPAIAHELGLDAALLRQWLRRGHVVSHGRDASGRVLLDFDAVERHARDRGLLDHDA